MTIQQIRHKIPLYTSDPSDRGVFQVRKFGDPWMVEKMGLTTLNEGPNFQHVNLWSPTHGWGAVHKFQKMDALVMAYLVYLQPNDYAQYGFTIEQKMNWHVGQVTAEHPNPERPWWTEGGRWDESWTNFSLGTMTYGGQYVKVETDAKGNPVEYPFYTYYPAGTKKEWITFYRQVGMRRDDFGKYTHESHPWYIQHATAANAKPVADTYSDHPRGVLPHPVISLDEYPANCGRDLFLIKGSILA